MESLGFELRPKFDPEYFDIMNGVGLGDFVEYMKGKSLETIRLPLNNNKAYQYLRWLNKHWCGDDDGCFLNYILNIWDALFSDRPVRPPTPREVAICAARRIVENADDKSIDDNERGMLIDSDAGMIKDAYHYWNYPIWVTSGLAGCVMKFGTFEDNVKPGDENNYITYEEEVQ